MPKLTRTQSSSQLEEFPPNPQNIKQSTGDISEQMDFNSGEERNNSDSSSDKSGTYSIDSFAQELNTKNLRDMKSKPQAPESIQEQPSFIAGLINNIRQPSMIFKGRVSQIQEESPTVELTAEEETDNFILDRIEHKRNISIAGSIEATLLPPSNWIGELQAGLKTTRNRMLGETPEENEEVDWEFWGKVINDYEGMVKQQPRQFQFNLHKGLPPPIRGMMWQLMSNSKSEILETEYLGLLENKSRHEKLIKRDLNRTYPEHEFFKEEDGPGQNSLFNILKVYSIYDKEIGYCQGLPFVVGALLLNMPEEQAFCVLVKLMTDYSFRDLYSPKMIGLQIRNYQFERLLEKKFPAVYKHLESEDIKSTMYASQWLKILIRFMTLFAYRFPLEIVYRILDIILAEGSEALLKFALALIQNSADTILTLEFEALIDFLKNDILTKYINNVNKFVQDATSINISKKNLDKWEKECLNYLKKNSPEVLEAEAVKAENRRLQQQIKIMEHNYELLNREHITFVNEMILEREKMAQKDERIKELMREVESKNDLLKRDRKVIEDEVHKEMHDLALKNSTLTSYVAALEETVGDLEHKLILSRNKLAESENELIENFSRRS